MNIHKYPPDYWSTSRLPGIPTKWQIGDNDKPGKVIAENGKVFDFINGPKGYDATHVGATIQTTQSDKNQFNSTVQTNKNDFDNNTFDNQNFEMNVCDADNENPEEEIYSLSLWIKQL